ncbi:dual specificity protein kinase TTK-like isoform X2 [Lytechinus variegatus]|uniref:dual specificity protein kinase TTK-like isoform X2 n=1 Tax=Lytechinus variegatus TaxID=7654 RepID=UPI001BB16CC3|nr:dual specificity protein kinase TTK-like isoform X2 [Lytechinus variegatus]
MSGNTRDNTTGNLTSLASFHSMTDHTEWMSELDRHGNKPSEWLAYLSLVESHTLHAEETSRFRFLSLAYNRATKQIPIDKYRDDPAYARIFIKLAHLKATRDVDDGRLMFKFARANVRKQAIVHLEAAKFEETHGDVKKCLSILEKGQKVTSDPKLTEAIHRVKNGLPILIDSQEPMDSHDGPQMINVVPPALVHPSHNEPEEKKSSHVPCTMEYVDTTVSFRRPEVGSRIPSQHKCESSDHEGDTMPINAGRYSGLQTPDVQNKMNVFGSSRRKRSNIGMPMRVSRTSLPQLKKESSKDDDDDDDEDDDDIRPLKSSPPEVKPGPLAPITEKTNESDSGVQTTPRDITQQERNPFPFKGRTVETPVESTVPGQWANFMKRQEPAMPVQQMGYDQTPLQQQWQQQPQQQPLPPQMGMPHVDMQQFQPLQQRLFQQPAPAVMQPSQQYPAPQMVAPAPQPKSKNIIQVNGKGYSIIRLIGKGGSSKVFQVLSEDSKKILALKYVKLDFADEMAIQSYMNEITLLERLKSFKRIIHLYDYEITEDYIYLVMECGSIDLATFLKKNKDSFSDHMWGYWKEMLEAVDVIHKQGIVHSDLKPANFIFVEASLKLIDFGIANAIQNDHTSLIKESQVGTLNYMSPEAIQDTSPVTEVNEYGHKKPRLKINCKSDVWSLGCILYSMVYGRTPFQHIVHRLLKMQAICNPDHVIDFPPIENKLLLDVMKKCLTRDVKKRPSIEELLNHPYLKKPFTAEKPAASLTTEHISALVSQLSQSQINSPRSIARLAQGVVEQISRGQQIDVSSAVKGSEQQQIPPAHQQYQYSNQPHPQPHPHQHGQASGHDGGYRSQRAPLRVINSSDVASHHSLLKPLSQAPKYDIGSFQENNQMNT